MWSVTQYVMFLYHAATDVIITAVCDDESYQTAVASSSSWWFFSGMTSDSPTSKFDTMLVAKHISMLATQHASGCLRENDAEPEHSFPQPNNSRNQAYRLHCTVFIRSYCSFFLPSVLWRCWLGVGNGIRPVKNWVVGWWCGCLSGATAEQIDKMSEKKNTTTQTVSKT